MTQTFSISGSFVFHGNRDQFQECYDAIKIEFNRNGVNRVALTWLQIMGVLLIPYL